MTIDEFPQELVHKRNVIESSFIFCLWKSPDIYGDYERELKADEDFITEEGKFYYSLGLSMYKLGYKSFDDITVYSYLEGKDIVRNKYERYGSTRTVDEMRRVLDISNIESYYDDLMKSNAILRLHKTGYNCIPEMTKFENMTYMQLEDYMEYKVNNIFLKSSINGMTITDLSDGYDKWIEEWDSGSGVGFPVGFPMLNYHLAGIHKKNLILHLASVGQGKAQPLYSKIMTPNGYIEMKDAKIGMDIFGEDGKVHQIVGVYPQGVKDVYEITFSDGSKVRSCDEHIWTVQDPKLRIKNQFKNMTLREIIDSRLYKTNKYGYKQWLYFVPMTKPLEFENKHLELDPYIFGILLGDGNFIKGTPKVTINNKEQDIKTMLEEYFTNKGFQFNLVSEDSRGAKTFRISDTNIKGNRLMEFLRTCGLYGKKSEEKHIPQEYLYSSVEDRINLLAGLIDSDGSIIDSKYSYSTSSHQLKEDVVFLVESLGGTANVENRQTYYVYKNEKKAGLPSYRIHIKMPRDIQAFKSEKHKSKFKIGQTCARRCIRKIEYIGKEETQCIMTNNPTHLYLTDNMVVTHNTTSAILMYVIPTLEKGEQVCIIANEQGEEDFRRMILATVLFNKIKYRKMNRQKFLFGNFTDEDKKALKEASDWLGKYKGKLHYAHLNDYDTGNIKRIIKKYSKLGVGIFLLDTLKPLDDSSDKAWGNFSEVSKDIFMLAQKEDIAIIATAQLSGASASRRYLDLSCIGKSKAIAETAGQVIMFRPLKQSEKEKLEVYTYMKDVDGKYTKAKKIIQLDVDKDYIVLFVPKNRYGQAGDLQIVYERNMSFNTMKELGYCHIEYDGFGK